MAGALHGLQLPVGQENRPQRCQRRLEIVIDDQIIEFGIVRYFADGVAHTPLDDRATVLRPSAQALVERLTRRRQNKNAKAIRQLRPHLACSLPVDFQDDIAPGRQPLQNPFPAGAVVVIEHPGVFQKNPPGR